MVNESSGDLMGNVGSPFDNGIAGLKQFFNKVLNNKHFNVLFEKLDWINYN